MVLLDTRKSLLPIPVSHSTHFMAGSTVLKTQRVESTKMLEAKIVSLEKMLNEAQHERARISYESEAVEKRIMNAIEVHKVHKRIYII